jgi:hypothetical protein
MSAAESSKAWTSIVSLAALGTSRASQPVDALWPDASLAMPGDTAEGTLLRLAAASYLWQLAGSRVAAAALTPVENAPPIEDKLVGEAAAWRMARMLSGDHRELLFEWFGLAAQAGRVLPPQWLPLVLDAVKPSEIELVAPVLGKRAVWLAARNPAWQVRDVSVSPSEERWVNGALAERVAELTSLRRIDPAGARCWAEKTWSVDPPEAREAFVRVLLDGVSAEDEAFLETALRDKRKAVRSAAVEGLARLPASAFARRNLDRIDPLLTFDPPGTGLLSKLKKRRLRVELPAALDKAAIRDGLDESPPASRKIGERAWWLVQMVSLVPPAHWATRFDCDAPTLIDAVADTEHGAELLSALRDAASRHADDTWLAALLQHLLAQRPAGEAAGAADTEILALMNATAPESRERLLAQALASIENSSFSLALALLNASAIDWSAETTRRAFELLSARVRGESQQWSFARNVLAAWGRHAHVGTAIAAIERVDARCPDPSPWRNAVEALKEIIEFRAAMRQELST